MPSEVWQVVQNTRDLQQTPEHEAQCRPCRPQAAGCHPLPHSNSREKEIHSFNSREKEIHSFNSRETSTHHCRIVCTTLISFIIRSIISITKLAIACTTLISFIISIISITQLTIVAINIASTTIIP
jgi:hypothetical protein